MKPLGLPLLADENIHPDVVAGLRAPAPFVQTLSLAGISHLQRC